MRVSPWLVAAALAVAAPAVSAPADPATSVALSVDRGGRPTAAVTINGEGPFELVVDTAAQRSTLTQPVIERLGLVRDQNTHGAVQGASGTTGASIYTLDTVALGSLERRNAMAVSLPNTAVSDSDGVLGADIFGGQRAEFDFASRRLTVSASGATPAGFTSVPVRLVAGTFAIVPIRIGGVDAVAVIDTGARYTLANGKLMAALGYAEGDSRLTVEEKPMGATGHVMKTFHGAKLDIALGGQTFAGAPLVFSDLPVFKPLGLADQPALILGIDVLGQFDVVAIDYPRAELQLRPRR